jgi:sulfate permease, SulP family
VPAVPASLVVVLGGVLVVQVAGLADRLDVVGHIDPGLPRLGVPEVAAGDWADLLPAAAGVLVIGFAEGLGAAKAYAARAGYRIDPNQELLALGLANVGSGGASGMVVNGSLSKTAVNVAAGARSQVSGLVVAVLSVVTLLVLTPVFEPLPEAVLAAVVIAAVAELVDVPALRALHAVWTARLGAAYGATARADYLGAVAALGGVLLLGTLRGLLVGVLVSLLLLLLRTSSPPVRVLTRVDGQWRDAARHTDVPPPEDAVVLRVEAPVHFANADHVRDEVVRHAAPGVRVVVLDVRTASYVDVTGARALADVAGALARRGVALRLAAGIGTVRDVLRLTDDLHRLTSYADVDEALAAPPAGPP